MKYAVPALVVAVIVIAYLIWFYRFARDKGPHRNAEGRIVETSATGPLVRFFREWFSRAAGPEAQGFPNAGAGGRYLSTHGRSLALQAQLRNREQQA